jgi:dihydroxyacetone kinase-like protein
MLIISRMPQLIEAVNTMIEYHAEAVTALDQAIGDGDHVINLQRGLQALMTQRDELVVLDWSVALQKIGMTLMSTVGGASGSLFGTLFVTMSKAAKDKPLDLVNFTNAFAQGVDAVKLRGKADVGEKTMLDVLVPVAVVLHEAMVNAEPMPKLFERVNCAAVTGVEATRDMLATKGRASFLAERSLGHIDAGAKTSQLMIAAVIDVLSATPA